MPSLGGPLLRVEDDATSDADSFAQNLTSLLQLADAIGTVSDQAVTQRAAGVRAR
jgi:hypothetical protein